MADRYQDKHFKYEKSTENHEYSTFVNDKYTVVVTTREARFLKHCLTKRFKHIQYVGFTEKAFIHAPRVVSDRNGKKKKKPWKEKTANNLVKPI